jgi:hypothetical protein
MADWKHKERFWKSESEYQSRDGNLISEDDDWVEDYLDFEDWLDLQCKKGWEVIKMWRSHNSGATTCIFRKKAE